jgi:hypothetical protein
MPATAAKTLADRKGFTVSETDMRGQYRLIDKLSFLPEPQVHDMCAGGTWPQIPAMCLEGGSGRQVRYVSATADAQIASDFIDRFNVAFE